MRLPRLVSLRTPAAAAKCGKGELAEVLMLHGTRAKLSYPEPIELWAPRQEYELRLDPTLKTAIEFVSLVDLDDPEIAIQQ